MCFYAEHEWTAAECDEQEGIVKGCFDKGQDITEGGSHCFCDDCRCEIFNGERAVFYQQWEYEQCPYCLKRHSEDDECEEASEGEENSFYRCMVCIDFRKAIKDMEMKEGCGEHESEPLYPMHEEFGEANNPDRFKEYFDHAITMFPERRDEFFDRFGVFLPEYERTERPSS